MIGDDAEIIGLTFTVGKKPFGDCISYDNIKYCFSGMIVLISVNFECFFFRNKLTFVQIMKVSKMIFSQLQFWFVLTVECVGGTQS